MLQNILRTATSVLCKRIFSKDGEIVTKKRNCSNAKTIIFKEKNHSDTSSALHQFLSPFLVFNHTILPIKMMLFDWTSFWWLLDDQLEHSVSEASSTEPFFKSSVEASTKPWLAITRCRDNARDFLWENCKLQLFFPSFFLFYLQGEVDIFCCYNCTHKRIYNWQWLHPISLRMRNLHCFHVGHQRLVCCVTNSSLCRWKCKRQSNLI